MKTIQYLLLFVAISTLSATAQRVGENPGQVGNLACREAKARNDEKAMNAFALYYSLPDKAQHLNGRVFREALRCAMRSGNQDIAVKWAREIPGARQLPAENAAVAAVFLAMSEGRDINVPELAQIATDKREKVLLDVANLFYLGGDDGKARRLSETRPEAVPHYSVAIVREAPVGVHAWQLSELYRTARRADEFVPYNRQAAEQLILDVNTVRGDVTAPSTDKKCPLWFQVAVDVRGISLYAEIPEENAVETESGILPGGLMEMYLQPGAGEFYYQWLWKFFPETVSFPEWMSPHLHYRQMQPFFKHEILTKDKKICLYMRIGWEALYDRLPGEDSEWRLGFIPWIKSGGFTWGNGGQVHELNKFGRLHFKGITAIMPEIKSRLVLTAWGTYKNAVPSLKYLWQDEFHGDRQFYREVLSPRFEALDAYGREVAEMNDETAERLFRKAVPQWLELPYVIADLRCDYLRRQLFRPQK